MVRDNRKNTALLLVIYCAIAAVLDYWVRTHGPISLVLGDDIPGGLALCENALDPYMRDGVLKGLELKKSAVLSLSELAEQFGLVLDIDAGDLGGGRICTSQQWGAIAQDGTCSVVYVPCRSGPLGRSDSGLGAYLTNHTLETAAAYLSHGSPTGKRGPPRTMYRLIQGAFDKLSERKLKQMTEFAVEHSYIPDAYVRYVKLEVRGDRPEWTLEVDYEWHQQIMPRTVWRVTQDPSTSVYANHMAYHTKTQAERFTSEVWRYAHDLCKHL